MESVVYGVSALTLFVVSELYIRLSNIEWYKKQKLVNIVIVLMAFVAVFSKGYGQYVAWPLFVLFTLLHLNDLKK